MPSGKSAQPLITDNLDGTVTVQYSPTEAGLHEMHIKYNGTHIPGQRVVTVTPAGPVEALLVRMQKLNVLTIKIMFN